MSGEKTNAFPTSFPEPRDAKMGCPLGHTPSLISLKIAATCIAGHGHRVR